MASGASGVGEVLVMPHPLHAFTMAICRADGSSAEEARLVADHLVLANLFGHDSHGVGIMPAYIQNTTTGHCVRNHHAKIVRDNGAVIVIDGGAGYGQVADHPFDLGGGPIAHAGPQILDRKLPIVVAKLDRLSRDVHHISGLMQHPRSSPSWAPTPTHSCCARAVGMPRSLSACDGPQRGWAARLQLGDYRPKVRRACSCGSA
jgi:Malate/L-lactate dehydrogenase